MLVCSTMAVVIAKINSQKCRRRKDLDDEFSLFFSLDYRNQEWSFTIPRPLVGLDGYTATQLENIESQLMRFELEFLPLDSYLN